MKKVLRFSRNEAQRPQPNSSHPNGVPRRIVNLESKETASIDQSSTMRKLRVRKLLNHFKTEGNEPQVDFYRINQNSHSPHSQDRAGRGVFVSFKKQEQIINRSISVYCHPSLGQSALLASRSNAQAQPSEAFAYLSSSVKQPIVSPPMPLNLKAIKQQIVAKIKQRLDLLRQEKLGPDRSGDSTLKLLSHLSQGDPSGQDRLYDYCLRKIHKCIQVQQKAAPKSLDKKYFQLKREGEELNRELESMRRTVWQQGGESFAVKLGVVGRGKPLSEERRPKPAKKSLRKRPLLTCSSFSGPSECRQSAIEGWEQLSEDY